MTRRITFSPRSDADAKQPEFKGTSAVAANGGGGGANGLTVQTRAPLLREESLMSGAEKKPQFTLVDRCLKSVDV